MNEHVKDLWLHALRDGEYVQGSGMLKTQENTYCCLGVLCDLYHKTTGKGLWDNYTNMGFDTIVFEEHEFNLPDSVVEWAGLSELDPFIEGEKLSIHNDGDISTESKTFPEIADLIERYL